jgi:hypothetical protein
MTPRDTFIRDLKRHPHFAGQPDIVKSLASAFAAMQSEGLEIDDAATCLRALEWIMAQDLTVDQKLHHISRLLSLGKVENLNLNEFIRLQ